MAVYLIHPDGHRIVRNGMYLVGQEDDPCCCEAGLGICRACPAQGIVGTYSNSTSAAAPGGTPTYTGPTVFTRTEETIDFEWDDTPGGGVNDAFQVEWTGTIYAPYTGTITLYVEVSNAAFYLQAGDFSGAGIAEINEWGAVTNGEFSDTFTPTHGTYYQFNLLFRSPVGTSSVKLKWSYTGQAKQVIPANMLTVQQVPFAAPTAALITTYYNDIDLTEPPAHETTSSIIDYSHAGEPVAGVVNDDNFSIRFEGVIQIPTSTTIPSASIVFSTQTTDGVRLWIDGSKIIDDWNDHGSLTTNTASAIVMRRGFYSVKMETYHKTGTATGKLRVSIDGGAASTGSTYFSTGIGEPLASQKTITFSGVTVSSACTGSGPSAIVVSGGLSGVTLCLRQVSPCVWEYDSRYDGAAPVVIHESALAACAGASLQANAHFVVQINYFTSTPVPGLISIIALWTNSEGVSSGGYSFFGNSAFRRPDGLCSSEMTIPSTITNPLAWPAYGGTAVITDGCDS